MMSTSFNPTCIAFLNFSGCWLHWSYLDSNWKKEEGYSPSQQIEDNSPTAKTIHQGIHFVLAYATGSVGHMLCSVSKIATFVLFIFVNCGFALHLAAGSLMQRITKTDDNGMLQVRKTYLFKGLLIMGDSVLALLIDVMGILCPPMAYHAHDYVKTHLLRPIDKQLIEPFPK